MKDNRRTGDFSMRDVSNRYQGLPPRTSDMLFNIVRKFYRGAVSHYDLIQEKKAEVRAASEYSQGGMDDADLRRALTTLFLEFHFYVTCWLQIELALYRLAKKHEDLAVVRDVFQPVLERHLAVREQLEQTEACVDAQFIPKGTIATIIDQDAYRFGEMTFTVDEQSLQSLHDLYQAIQTARQEDESQP
jgi:hypothetical protein